MFALSKKRWVKIYQVNFIAFYFFKFFNAVAVNNFIDFHLQVFFRLQFRLK